MRAFVVLACVALAYGRPEPPVGYSYSAPTVRYTAPISTYGAPISGHSAISGGLSLGSLSGGHSADSLSLSGGISSAGLSYSSGSIAEGFRGGSVSGFGGVSSFDGGFAGGYAGAPLVQKHIYVHVPPPEPEEQRLPRITPVAPPQKHYKIIFIKAPTPPTPVAPIIPVQQQNEEKTLVYVLVKKPEEQPDIVIPTPAPTQPSKPEVYFIKYQTQKEADAVIAGGISGSTISGAAIGGATGISSAEIGGGIGSGDLSVVSGGTVVESSGHGGVEISDFGGSHDDAVLVGGRGSAVASTQYGPPGHVPGPIH